ncbi:uncharacterized protein EKO05_0001797 [Ascochyta rabiei]|uniref:uncharacterized protein n=1 Tax=Didymella rabiei TaxID=5454 RepID=UPI0019002888|nr:uncharacterized protein EKO05_0001797 [Ascochyta rabiei]UPX11175.1 hypothetical protein EKO05_0001797 [Ascochyta rabiei]
MKSATALLALCAVLCGRVAHAQEGFRIPSPDVNDLDPSLTIVQGEVVQLAWAANYTYQPSVDGKPVMGSDGRASLWLTSWAWNGARFGKLLTPSVISEGDSSWAYQVDLTDAEIDRWNGGFTYRLMKPVTSSNAAFEDSDTAIVSRAFIVRKKSDVAASIASVSASYSRALAASTASATQSTTAADAASSTATRTAGSSGPPSPTASSPAATATDSESSSTASGDPTSTPTGGLSTGAKAGIAIGAVAAVAIAALAALSLIRRRRKASHVAAYNDQSAAEKFTPQPQHSTVYRHEAPDAAPAAHEMSAHQRDRAYAELDGSSGKP